jgi:glutaminyl-peptide cyclotransferase
MEAEKRADRRSARVLWGGMLAGGLIAAGIAFAAGFREPAEETVAPVDITPSEAARPALAREVEDLSVRVVRKFPHAADAFTQGLIWHEGAMYESTGQYGRSSLRKVQLENGKVLAERTLESRFFGEGLARVDDRLIQLTWRAGLAFVSDLTTLEERKTLGYAGEGWGLCYDGTALVMSDGSSMLEFRDPESMALLGAVSVLKNGHPVRKLNELECVGSEVYANIWQRNEILRIDRQSGRVTATIDASGLLSRSEARRAGVLNGIAYKPESKTFLLTGKLWPHVFEVELVPR